MITEDPRINNACETDSLTTDFVSPSRTIGN